MPRPESAHQEAAGETDDRVRRYPVPVQWTEWVKAHPGQFLSLVGVLFIGVKLLAVSRFQATSALAIATAAGAGEIALAMLVLGYPLLLTAVGCAGVFHFLHVVQQRPEAGAEDESEARRAWVSLAVGIVALALINLSLLGILAVVSIQPLLAVAAERNQQPGQLSVPGIGQLRPALDAITINDLERAREATQDEKAGARLERQIERLRAKPAVEERRKAFWSKVTMPLDYLFRSIFWLAPLGMFAYLSLSSRMWVPPEIVTLDTDRRVVAYVMGSDGGWTSLLSEKGRVIIRVKSESIETREVCRLSPGVASQSIVQLVLGAETTQPCPRDR